MRTVRRGFATTAGRGASPTVGTTTTTERTTTTTRSTTATRMIRKPRRPGRTRDRSWKRAVGVCELCTANCRRFRFNRRGDEKSTFDRRGLTFRARASLRGARRVSRAEHASSISASRRSSRTPRRARTFARIEEGCEAETCTRRVLHLRRPMTRYTSACRRLGFGERNMTYTDRYRARRVRRPSYSSPCARDRRRWRRRATREENAPSETRRPRRRRTRARGTPRAVPRRQCDRL